MKVLKHLINIKSQLLTLLIAIFMTGALVACTSFKNTEKVQQQNEAFSDIIWLKYQKTPCYGECPAYEAQLAENGEITIIPWEHLPTADTLTFALPAKDLQHLRKQVNNLNLSELKSSYLSDWSDTPSQYITFYKNGTEIKRVKHQKGGPESLQTLLSHLDSTLLNLVGQHTK